MSDKRFADNLSSSRESRPWPRYSKPYSGVMLEERGDEAAAHRSLKPATAADRGPHDSWDIVELWGLWFCMANARYRVNCMEDLSLRRLPLCGLAGAADLPLILFKYYFACEKRWPTPSPSPSTLTLRNNSSSNYSHPESRALSYPSNPSSKFPRQPPAT